jgi:hypothetical protein
MTSIKSVVVGSWIPLMVEQLVMVFEKLVL